MAMVTVYSFKGYDPESREMKTAKRKATREAIQMCKGAPIEDTAEEVDEARLDGDGFRTASEL